MSVQESLRGILPVYDHPGLLISTEVITNLKASFPEVEQFIVGVCAVLCS